MNLLWWTI